MSGPLQSILVLFISYKGVCNCNCILYFLILLYYTYRKGGVDHYLKDFPGGVFWRGMNFVFHKGGNCAWEHEWEWWLSFQREEG
jgi:hypothetical protein